MKTRTLAVLLALGIALLAVGVWLALTTLAGPFIATPGAILTGWTANKLWRRYRPLPAELDAELRILAERSANQYPDHLIAARGWTRDQLINTIHQHMRNQITGGPK